MEAQSVHTFRARSSALALAAGLGAWLSAPGAHGAQADGKSSGIQVQAAHAEHLGQHLGPLLTWLALSFPDLAPQRIMRMPGGHGVPLIDAEAQALLGHGSVVLVWNAVGLRSIRADEVSAGECRRLADLLGARHAGSTRGCLLNAPGDPAPGRFDAQRAGPPPQDGLRILIPEEVLRSWWPPSARLPVPARMRVEVRTAAAPWHISVDMEWGRQAPSPDGFQPFIPRDDFKEVRGANPRLSVHFRPGAALAREVTLHGPVPISAGALVSMHWLGQETRVLSPRDMWWEVRQIHPNESAARDWLRSLAPTTDGGAALESCVPMEGGARAWRMHGAWTEWRTGPEACSWSREDVGVSAPARSVAQGTILMWEGHGRRIWSGLDAIPLLAAGGQGPLSAWVGMRELLAPSMERVGEMKGSVRRLSVRRWHGEVDMVVEGSPR